MGGECEALIMENIAITIVQADLVWENKQANLDKFEQLFSKLTGPTDLIVLPEMFTTGFATEPQKWAEHPNGATLHWMKFQATALNACFVGSYVVTENNKYYNRLVFMHPNGEYETYDKKHLFQHGNEHLHYTAGNQTLIVDVKGWKICPMICYDLRFPVWSRNRYRDGFYEYDLLLYIANWPMARSRAYKQLLIARAIENQVYVVGVNRVGIDGKGVDHAGDSAVLDFDGKPLLGIPSLEEGIETVSIRYDELAKARTTFEVAKDWDSFSIEN